MANFFSLFGLYRFLHSVTGIVPSLHFAKMGPSLGRAVHVSSQPEINLINWVVTVTE